MKNRPIGFFDSGIGGLTMLAESVKIMPDEKYLYYGDNKNAPYGNRTGEEIYALTQRAFKYFEKKKVKAVVLACNTVTAECAALLREKYAFLIIGTEPAVCPAVKNGGSTAVLCTPATALSKKFKRLTHGANDVTVIPQKHLAGDIENGFDKLEDIAKEVYFKVKDYHNVVLGCTHYIYLKEYLSVFGAKNLFDGNAGTVKNLKKSLCQKGLLRKGKGKVKFCGSGKNKNKKLFKRFYSYLKK